MERRIAEMARTKAAGLMESESPPSQGRLSAFGRANQQGRWPCALVDAIANQPLRSAVMREALAIGLDVLGSGWRQRRSDNLGHQ